MEETLPNNSNTNTTLSGPQGWNVSSFGFIKARLGMPLHLRVWVGGGGGFRERCYNLSKFVANLKQIQLWTQNEIQRLEDMIDWFVGCRATFYKLRPVSIDEYWVRWNGKEMRKGLPVAQWQPAPSHNIYVCVWYDQKCVIRKLLVQNPMSKVTNYFTYPHS
jgi:hypothetical protein